MPGQSVKPVKPIKLEPMKKPVKAVQLEQSPDIDVPELLQEKRCYPCHSESGPLLGPSYEDIARKHGERREIMVKILAQKIVDGGGRNWGVVPMVPNEQVTMDEARIMAEWILDSTPQ
jgi:cytochrome c